MFINDVELSNFGFTDDHTTVTTILSEFGFDVTKRSRNLCKLSIVRIVDQVAPDEDHIIDYFLVDLVP